MPRPDGAAVNLQRSQYGRNQSLDWGNPLGRESGDSIVRGESEFGRGSRNVVGELAGPLRCDHQLIGHRADLGEKVAKMRRAS